MRVERVVAWFRQRPTWVADGLLALTLTVVELLMLPTAADAAAAAPKLSAVATSAVVATGTLPLAWRRVAPVAVLTGVGVVAVVLAWAEAPIAGLAVLVALYTVGAHRPRRSALRALAAVLAVSSVGLAFGDALALWWIGGLAFSACVALGDRSRVARLRAAELTERARELEAERGERLRLAVAGERARIARELHDVAAHGVAVIAVQAGGARRVLRTDPDRAEEALRAIEETARGSLTEIRQAVALLRDDDPSAVPQPGLEQLPGLLDRFRDAGLELVADVPDVARPVPRATGLAVYRVVQEALTNVLRHAGPTTAHVRLRVARNGVRVVVADDGPRGGGARRARERRTARDRRPAPGATAASTGGFGLIGLRERVRAHGGSLRAGPVRRGFLVDARLPLPPDDATPSPGDDPAAASPRRPSPVAGDTPPPGPAPGLAMQGGSA